MEAKPAGRRLVARRSHSGPKKVDSPMPWMPLSVVMRTIIQLTAMKVSIFAIFMFGGFGLLLLCASGFRLSPE